MPRLHTAEGTTIILGITGDFNFIIICTEEVEKCGHVMVDFKKQQISVNVMWQRVWKIEDNGRTMKNRLRR